MKIILLHSTPLFIASMAIRKCWASEGKSDTEFLPKHNCINLDSQDVEIGEKDKALIHRIGNKNKHSSTLEHLNYSFDIDGISRACLQELARHRMASLSVKSSRYTLKELTNTEGIDILKDFLVLTGDAFIDDIAVGNLFSVRKGLKAGKSNDIAKFPLPEAYKTSLVWTVNARSLQNFLALRTNKAALWEIRDLAFEIFAHLPEEHKYLFEECLYTEEKSPTATELLEEQNESLRQQVSDLSQSLMEHTGDLHMGEGYFDKWSEETK